MNVLPFDRQVAVVSALCEGCSIRATERLTGVHRDTVMRLGVRVGEGCARLHDYLFRDLNIAFVQLDELWSFVAKKQKRVTDEEHPTKGDFYTFIALDRVLKAIIAYRTGKRDGDTTELFLTDLRSRLLNKPMISSDAFRYYERGVRTAFGSRVEYGQVIKSFDGIPDFEGQRRYSPGSVMTIEKRQLIGAPDPNLICTSHIERQNLSVRMSSRRFTRLTNGFSKKAENHAAAVSLYVTHYNLCRVHETIRTTPAAAMGIAVRPWSVAELLEAAVMGAVEPPPGRRVGRFRVIDGGG